MKWIVVRASTLTADSLSTQKALLVPPDTPHRLTTGEGDTLKMFMLRRDPEPEVTPRERILVRDIGALALTERNVN